MLWNKLEISSDDATHESISDVGNPATAAGFDEWRSNACWDDGIEAFWFDNDGDFSKNNLATQSRVWISLIFKESHRFVENLEASNSRAKSSWSWGGSIKLLVIDWAAADTSDVMPKSWLMIDAPREEDSSKICWVFPEFRGQNLVSQLAGDNEVTSWCVENWSSFLVEVAPGLSTKVRLKSCPSKENRFSIEWEESPFNICPY